MGKDRVHRYLANYLEGRKGNCITMPILFAILGRSIGLNMTLATAPHHLYVIFTDDQGKAWNLETTSGAGYTRASYIRTTMPMSDRALQNGVYMRPLSDVEVVSIMASVVVEGLMQRQEFEEAIAVSDALLAHDPNSVRLILTRGSSFAGILRRDILSKYTKVDQLTRDQLVWAEFLSDTNKLAFDTVEALGWSEQDGEQDKWPPYVKKEGEE